MFRQIYAVPRMVVRNLITHHKRGDIQTRSILISIFTDLNQRLITQESHRELLRTYGFVDWLELAFIDVTPGDFAQYISVRGDAAGHQLFSHEQAGLIRNFVDKYKNEDMDRLLIHCDAGQSRSGAIAAWAYYYLNRHGLVTFTPDKFWASNKDISPNPFVARMMCEASGMEYLEADF